MTPPWLFTQAAQALMALSVMGLTAPRGDVRVSTEPRTMGSPVAAAVAAAAAVVAGALLAAEDAPAGADVVATWADVVGDDDDLDELLQPTAMTAATIPTAKPAYLDRRSRTRNPPGSVSSLTIAVRTLGAR